VETLINQVEQEVIELRRYFHENPELSNREFKTAERIAEALRNLGLKVDTGIAITGVVATLDSGKPGPTIGLRADIDGLPVVERAPVPFASKVTSEFLGEKVGVMHACGHDAHTAMLLGAARYLSESRNFTGRAVFIFQPAEEGLGGARAMLADGLFERFPCDEIYGMHNNPNGKPGTVGVKPGVAMAGADFFDITIHGQGSHGAIPQQSRDPIVIGTSLVQQLQSIVSRNVPATEQIVLSVTQIHAGAAYNVIPGECTISGTMRYFDPDVAKLVRDRVQTLCDGIAKGFDVEITIDNRDIFDVLVNDDDLSHVMLNIASEVVGEDNVGVTDERRMGSEDFADMLRVVPGAYCTVGHAGTQPLHANEFFLDEDILPVGASIYAKIVERRTAA